MREELLSLGRLRGGSSERGDKRGGSSFSSHRRDGFLFRELLSTHICIHTHTQSCFHYFWGHYIGLNCFPSIFYPMTSIITPVYTKLYICWLAVNDRCLLSLLQPGTKFLSYKLGLAYPHNHKWKKQYIFYWCSVTIDDLFTKCSLKIYSHFDLCDLFHLSHECIIRIRVVNQQSIKI